MAGKTLEKTKKENTEQQAEKQVTEKNIKIETEEKKKIVPKKIDPNQIVTVRNGFQGRLIYKSRKTGEVFVWESFGDEQDMELSEIKNARNSNKKFFVNNWFMFDEDWIPEYVGMSKYYKFAVSVDGFDKIFEKDPDELREIIENMSAGQKKSVAYRARQLIADGKIDSNKVITVLEKCLGVDLIER